MQFTVDAHVLWLALKRLNLRCDMHAFVLLQAHDGKLTLATTAEEYASRWSPQKTSVMRASLSLSESLTIEKEGQHCARYQPLVNAVSVFDGCITVRQEESAVIVSQESERKCQIPVEGIKAEHFPQPALLPAERETYTTKEFVSHECATCGSVKHREQVDLYQVLKVVTQRTCIERERLFAMFKQVRWAVAEDDSGRRDLAGVSIRLKEDVFSLKALNGYCFAVHNEQLGGEENWEYSILVPAKRLERALQLLPRETDVRLEAVLTQHQHIKRDDQDVPEATPFIRAEEVRLFAGNLCITLSLMNTKVPSIHKLISEEREIRVVCVTADLQNAIEAVGKVAQECGKAVWLHIGETGMRVETKHHLASSKLALHEVPISTKTGQDISVPLSATYLRNAVRAVTAPKVTIELSAPDKIVVLHTLGSQEDYLSVVMPVKTNE